MLRDIGWGARDEQRWDEPGEITQPRRSKLPNARLVDPLWHGDQCEGLSGLYSIVNGIRLALAHKHQFDGAELHGLMVAGLRFVDGRLTPERAVTCGLRIGLWRRMAEALTHRTRDRRRVLLYLEPVFVPAHDRTAAWEAIEKAIDCWRPLLMLMRGGRYTVVCGYTTSSLLLFDSSGAYWISKRATGVPGDCHGARHIVYPASFLALRA